MAKPDLDDEFQDIKISWCQYDKLLDASAQISALLHIILAVPHLETLPRDTVQYCLLLAEQMAYKNYELVQSFHASLSSQETPPNKSEAYP